MDEEKKDDELEKKNEEKAESEENVNSETKEKEYVPEQLDDDDFEKEKEQAKKEKKEKKKKDSEKIEYDENGNPIAKKKNGKLKIVAIIILIVIIAVGGTIAYLVINPNNEVNFFSELMIESLIKDYAIYINNEEWENVVDCADIDGYLAYYVVYMEDYLIDMLETYGLATDMEAQFSYQDYDQILANTEYYYEEFEKEFGDYLDLDDYYDTLRDYVEYGEANLLDSFEVWTEDSYTISDIEIENIKSISKIGGTDSLYMVSVVYSYVMPNYSSSSTTVTEDIYVARVDGEYKIVGGENLGSVLMSVYYDGYYAVNSTDDSETTTEE